MSLNNQVDDFEPEVVEQEDDFTPDDFEPEEVPKRKLEDLGWLEKNFTTEGQELQAGRNRNLVKGVASGLTAGFSEAIPGFEVEDNAEGTTGKVVGSLAPIGLAAKGIAYPLKAAAYAAPKLAKPIMHLGNLLGLSAAGGIYEGLEESAEKSVEANEFVPPSLDTIAEQGAKWGALDLGLRALGWGGRFVKGLFDKSSELKVPAMELLENISQQITGDKVAEKALSILENKPLGEIEQQAAKVQKTPDISPFAIEQRVQERSSDLRNRKIAQKDFTKLESGIAIEPKPYLPAEFQAETIAEDVLSNDLTQRIEGISQRATTERELGQSVQKDIERNITQSKKETDALYDVAKEVESTSRPNVEKTANSIVEQLNKLEGESINLTPEGYSKAEKQLRQTLTDLGYGIEVDEAGKVIRAVKNSDIPLSKAVELKRRLNNIINYDLIDTSAQDFLKGPAHELRGEIRVGYGDKNSPARKAFEEAETKFGEFAEKKGKKSIRSMRTSEKPESIANTIRTPSGLADIKDVVSPEQFAQVERELLEHMRGLSEEKAAAFYREMRPSLTQDIRSIAEEIIESKAPKNSSNRKVAQREAIQKKALDDIAKATITGERPEVALDLWKTSEGQQLIKQSLENNPNKKEVLKYLQDQSFKDFSASVVNADGLVDFKKLDKLLKDKATLNNVRLVAGEDGVNFLKNLETLSSRVKKNASILEGKISKGSAKEREAIQKDLTKRGEQRFKKIKDKRLSAEEAEQKSGLLYKLDDLVSSYGWKGKGVLAALGVLKYGTAEGIALATSYEIFMRLAKNKKVQSAIKRAAAPNSSPVELMRSIFSIADAADED